MALEAADHLYLAGNTKIVELLKPNNEVVQFTDYVVKINRKKKEQTRTIMITDQAVYNLMPNNHSKCKRRIALSNIVSVTASEISDEFILHVPDEYDYHLKSARKDDIIEMLSANMKNIDINGNKKRLNVTKFSGPTLDGQALTKAQARQLTREDMLMLKKKLAAVEAPSDEEDRMEVEKDKTDHSIEQHPNMLTTDSVGIVDFELLKVLGRGAFGKVMQVKKKSDGKVYAMKILKKNAIIARNQVEHTKAERKILQTLQHPFLMTLRYAFQSKEKLYLVLDYFQGGELFFHLKEQRRFDEEVARLYVAEIAMAFGHLHASGVIYRDLKPENILLDDNGHVCLTDFGLAKELEETEKTQTFCGTPEYLAPEIIQGLGHDKAVDWWSLGILLYELTVGIPPFYSQNVNEMYTKIQHGVLRFPPFLSDECKVMIVALLNRDAKLRLGSKQGPDGDFAELKIQPFFKDINWEDLFAKKIPMKFTPKVSGKDGVMNFDPEFLMEPVIDSVVPPSNFPAGGKEEFTGFTYKGEGGHLG